MEEETSVKVGWFPSKFLRGASSLQDRYAGVAGVGWHEASAPVAWTLVGLSRS